MDYTNADTTQSEDSIMPTRDLRSYLIPRDPSIISYNHRPIISRNCVLNLESALSKELQKSKDTVKVYLRMKPFLPSEGPYSDWEMNKAYEIMNETTLMTRLPKVETNTKKTKSPEVVSKKYIFTKTFDADTNQLKIFDEAIKPHMINFLKGVKNSVIMTYGTSNSGKSYTLRGKNNNPGIIPRGLEFIFNNVTVSENLIFKPVNYSDVVRLNELELQKEKSFKESLFSHPICTKSKSKKQYEDMQKSLANEISKIDLGNDTEFEYSLWVSFAEIYNESVYDLLSYEDYLNKQRKALNVSTDAKGQMFIKDLKMINVSSGAEAYQVLMAGQYNLKIAATGINAQSSRSHSIFTVKMLKYKSGWDAKDVVVSTFTFCDLAGSERLSKTQNVGERLKEAQNINTSLLVLGRCLRLIHEYQATQVAKKKSETLPPFRESKLTRLLQKALSGKEHVALIINVSQVPELYVETQHVLKLAAIAKKIVQEVKPVNIPKPLPKRFSMTFEHTRRTQTDWDDVASKLSDKEEEESKNSQEEETEEDDSTYVDKEEYDRLVLENAQLKKQIAKNNQLLLKRDMETRAELINMYTEMMNKKDEEFKKRLEEQEASNEEYMAWREEVLQSDFEDKLKNSDSSLVEELQAEVEELTEKYNQLNEKVQHKKSKIKELRNEKESLAIDLKHTESELQNCKQLLEAKESESDSKYVNELKSQLETAEERSKKLQDLLDSAKEEVLGLQSYEARLQQQLNEKDALLQNSLEQITELEEQLEVVNSLSASKTTEIEQFEALVDQQTKTIIQKEVLFDALKKEKEEVENLVNKMCDEVETLKKQLQEAQYELMLVKEVNVSSMANQTKDEEQIAELIKTNQDLTDAIRSLEKSEKKSKERLAETNKLLEEFKANVSDLKDRLRKKEDEIAQLKENHTSILSRYESCLDSKNAEIVELKKSRLETPSISRSSVKTEQSSQKSKASKDDSDEEPKPQRSTTAKKRAKKVEPQSELTTDDEAPRRMTRSTRKRAAPLFTSTVPDDVDTIDSSPESKKKSKVSSTQLLPPTSTKTRRSPRKALFYEEEKEAIDLSESVPGSPLPVPKSLRKRRR